MIRARVDGKGMSAVLHLYGKGKVDGKGMSAVLGVNCEPGTVSIYIRRRKGMALGACARMHVCVPNKG